MSTRCCSFAVRRSPTSSRSPSASVSVRSRRPSGASPARSKRCPEISNLSNVDAENRLIPAGDKRNIFNAGNQMWHTDSSFKSVPALASLLSGREVPTRGRRHGVRQHARGLRAPARGFEALPRGQSGHSQLHVLARPRQTRGSSPPSTPPRCRRSGKPWSASNPANGRKAFYVASHACEIVGVPTDEARALSASAASRRPRGQRSCTAPLARRRSRDVGQPVHAAPGSSVGRVEVPPRHAPHDGGRRWSDRPRRHVHPRRQSRPRRRRGLGPVSAGGYLTAEHPAGARVQNTTTPRATSPLVSALNPSLISSSL